jgi:hypothetical protein
MTGPADGSTTPARPTGTPFLDRLRLDGAIFLRAEYSEPWAYESLDGPATAAALRPGSRQVTLFHVIAAGARGEAPSVWRGRRLAEAVVG